MRPTDDGGEGCPHEHESPRCHICGTDEGPLIERYRPSASGPGCCVRLCTLCLMLPADPEAVPPIVDEILARKGQQL